MIRAVRRLRPAADRRDRARGERRHRQDVHDRRARRALRRRGHRRSTQLLLVTFTRMATGELRERVRERLVSAGAGLAAPPAPPPDDDVVALLADGSAEEVAAPARRLAAALADFDAATIATTHGFCQEVLGGLGVAGDVERDADVRRGRRATSLERGRRRPLRPPLPRRGDAPPFTRAEALRDRRASRSTTRPRRSSRRERDRTTRRAMRGRLAGAVRERARARASGAAGVMTYDDLLTRLRRDARTGRAATTSSRRLRAPLQVVLVDEFQDTDPVQWEILRRAFGDGDGTLVLIGDPKQAIYAFRGADVYAYLRRRRGRRRRSATLRRNWRSDRACSTPTTRCSAARGSATRGSSTARSRPPRATARRACRRAAAAPLRVRVVDRDDAGDRPRKRLRARAGRARAHRRATSPPTSSRLLRSDATVVDGRRRPSVARRHRGARAHATATARAGARRARRASACPPSSTAPAACSAPTPAREWLRLLEALERPAVARRARTRPR